MCRLFGLHAGRSPVTATFWLVGPPTASRRRAVATPTARYRRLRQRRRARRRQATLAAWNDPAFAEEAHELHGTTFVAHVRHASTGSNTVANTHRSSKTAAVRHNGVVQGTDQLDAHLRELGAGALVHVTRTASASSRWSPPRRPARRRRGGGPAGRAQLGERAPRRVLAQSRAHDAPRAVGLRYPSTTRSSCSNATPGHGWGGLDVTGSRLRARAEHLERRRSVVVASEAMDGEQGWRLLESGELVHVGADLSVTSELAFPEEPGTC